MSDQIFARIARCLTVFALAAAVAVSVLPAAPAAAEEASEAPALKKVESKYVCMVNDALFAKEQIPVEVEGRTYFGCCEMCKERLAVDAGARQAVDPISGSTVDKATAVIGAQEDGTVFYFESEENLEAFNQSQGS